MNTSQRSPYRYLLAMAVAFIGFYVPFLRGPGKSYFRIADNLNSAFVYNVVGGIYYKHPQEARHLLLAGSLPVYSLMSLTWPLTLLNILPDQFLAYVLTDFVVRFVALAGMFLLARRLGVSGSVAATAAMLFALSLTFTTFGLSIAGIPAVIYVAQKEADGRASWWGLGIVALIGWNSMFAFTGIFLLIMLYPLRSLLFAGSMGMTLKTFAAYFSGLVLGNAGLVYSIFSRIPMQRDAWEPGRFGVLRVGRLFVHNLLNPSEYYFHVAVPLTFLYIAAICAAFRAKSKTVAGLVLCPVAFNLFASITQYRAVGALRDHIGGLARTFNFTRFFFLDSALIVLAWAVAMHISGPRMKRFLVGAAALQLVTIAYLSPHIGLPSEMTFSDYYKQADYREIKSEIGDAPTLSVGVDPMAAVMNHISAVDGFYTVYPLSYKPRFRRIIAAQLSADQRGWFDNWGSQLYTFADRPDGLALDYCAAADLGARYVISRFRISDPRLALVKETREHCLVVYLIGKCGA